MESHIARILEATRKHLEQCEFTSASITARMVTPEARGSQALFMEALAEIDSKTFDDELDMLMSGYMRPDDLDPELREAWIAKLEGNTAQPSSEINSLKKAIRDVGLDETDILASKMKYFPEGFNRDQLLLDCLTEYKEKLSTTPAHSRSHNVRIGM